MYEKFNIPPTCKIGSTIFKKLIYENAELSKADRDLFTNVVDKIIWVYCLKPETTNIQPYHDEMREYPEVEIIEAALTDDRKTTQIAEIIMRTIPYPMLLVLKYESKVQLFVAHQRTNQNDGSKNTLEDIISTGWLPEDNPLFEKLDMRQMRLTNFFTLYSDMVDAVSIFNASQLTPAQINLTGDQARALTARMEEIERQIADLRAGMKKETQFNRRVKLNMEIKKLETDISKLILRK